MQRNHRSSSRSVWRSHWVFATLVAGAASTAVSSVGCYYSMSGKAPPTATQTPEPPKPEPIPERFVQVLTPTTTPAPKMLGRMSDAPSTRTAAEKATRGANGVYGVGQGYERRATLGHAVANQGLLQVLGEGGAEQPPITSDANARYAHFADNPMHLVAQDPLSTFSIDVDTASWSNVRRFLRAGQTPPAGAVRVEEMINYFPTEDAPPSSGEGPFAVHLDGAECPWAPGHRLVRIGVQGRRIAPQQGPATNLVFLVDVSGSMSPPDRLPLVRHALELLVDRLGPRDHVAIVTYAGASGLALPWTSGDDKDAIRSALRRLESGGSTNGGEGIQLAYDLAEQHFLDGGVNRVILATDGDFNVGVTSQEALVKLIEKEAKRRIYLTVLGVGDDNYQDATMEALADHGHGNYAYLDSAREAFKVLVEQQQSTLITIARDVKVQVEFNPARVAGYRLVGYEDRVMAAQDFADDSKDAGDIGAGHHVTALYEIVPSGTPTPGVVAPLKYQAAPTVTAAAAASGELLTVKLRYKDPDATASKLVEVPYVDAGRALAAASTDLRFAAAVAELGLLLRGSLGPQQASYHHVVELARGSLGADPGGYRSEMVALVEPLAKAERVARR